MSATLQSAVALARKYLPPNGVTFSYGTAGFRCDASLLPSVVVRMGMLAAIRGRCVSETGNVRAVGVMITASHNKVSDNGLKMVDYTGGMLAQEWERYLVNMANCAKMNLESTLMAIIQTANANMAIQPVVFVGRDTRPSSPELHDLLVRGVVAMGGVVKDFGVVCTPQLHFMVGSHNRGQPATLEHYYDTLANAFSDLVSDVVVGNDQGDEAKEDEAKQLVPTVVDCADGVGAVSLRELRKHKNVAKYIKIDLRNTGEGDDAVLNHLVGAEHVQKKRQLPRNVDAAKDAGIKFASLDGDADRIVFYFVDKEGGLHLMDGDKIVSLVTGLIKELIKKAQIDESAISVGVVQTAYANGASTAYIAENLGVKIECARTGVKYVHHKAEEFDVGAYFEANGHGTVLFSAKAVAAFEKAAASGATEEARRAGAQLVSLNKLINPFIGDAVSDLLLVEAALARKGWTMNDWDTLYADLPSLTDKTAVKDRTLVKTTNAERTCTAPAGLQAAIDELVAQVPQGRAFVRPSGTEDVVRVYSEASTQEAADKLNADVAELVRKFVNNSQ